tara:strand:- start:747 stop:1733 length:987 start_codon:yes stop_codon:yes gene_type:complete
MRLEIGQLIDRHIGKPAIVTGHGPSLSQNIEQIESMQKDDKIIRFSLNDWFKFFRTPPEYWVLANNIDTVSRHLQVMNECNSTVLLGDTVDLTSDEFMEQKLQCDYFPYDQRHFKGHTCAQIWYNFSNHAVSCQNKKDYKFTYYGNNSKMWNPTDAGSAVPPIRWELPANISAAKSVKNCCYRIQNKETVQAEARQLETLWETTPNEREDVKFSPPQRVRLTIQENLQKISGHESHYSPGDTVILHAIAAAIIMGCNPIYITGMDLDYSIGYANGTRPPNDNGWQKENVNLINDLKILEESAKKRNIRIINLKKDAWYGVFELGEIKK